MRGNTLWVAKTWAYKCTTH